MLRLSDAIFPYSIGWIFFIHSFFFRASCTPSLYVYNSLTKSEPDELAFPLKLLQVILVVAFQCCAGALAGLSFYNFSQHTHEKFGNNQHEITFENSYSDTIIWYSVIEEWVGTCIFLCSEQLIDNFLKKSSTQNTMNTAIPNDLRHMLILAFCLIALHFNFSTFSGNPAYLCSLWVFNAQGDWPSKFMPQALGAKFGGQVAGFLSALLILWAGENKHKVDANSPAERNGNVNANARLSNATYFKLM